MKKVKQFSRDEFPKTLFLELTHKIYGTERVDKLPPGSDYQQDTFFLFEGDKVMATATIFLNPQLNSNDNTVLLIGGFETIDSECKLLFEAIEQRGKELGVNQLIGPMNGSTWNNHRFIIGGQQDLFISEISHPDYYPLIWETNNFRTFQTYHSYKDEKMDSNNGRLLRLEAHFDKLNIRVRKIDLSVFESELARIYKLCIRAFEHNVLYSEIAEQQFIGSYAPLKNGLKEDYIWLAEDEEKRCVGFLFAFENKWNVNEHQLVVKTIAKDPRFRFNGLGTLLGNRFMEKARANGVTSVIHAFMHKKNVSKNLSERFNGELIRTYALFSKMIEE